MECTLGDINLPKKGIVSKLLNVLNKRNILILKRIDLGFVDEIMEKSGPGRPPTYLPHKKLKAILYGWSERERYMTRIAEKVKGLVGKIVCGFKETTPSHDTLSDFWNVLKIDIETIFEKIVEVLVSMGLVSERVRTMDSTPMIGYKNDYDSVWNYDSIRKRKYKGYNLLMTCDPYTHTVTAARLSKKKVKTAVCLKVVSEDQVRCKSKVMTADSEFDMISLQNQLLNGGTIPAIPRNKRNNQAKRLRKFRVQEILPIRTWFLRRLYKLRIESEHLNNELKTELGLEDIRLKGMENVNVHTFLILIWRNLHILYNCLENHHVSIRRINGIN